MASATMDTRSVLDAIQLGWSMAELRARYWMAQRAQPRAASGATPADSSPHFLPVGRKRSPAELAIQTYVKAGVHGHQEGGGNGTQNDNERNAAATGYVREIEGRAATR